MVRNPFLPFTEEESLQLLFSLSPAIAYWVSDNLCLQFCRSIDGELDLQFIPGASSAPEPDLDDEFCTLLM